jgi:hypothetical protein
MAIPKVIDIDDEPSLLRFVTAIREATRPSGCAERVTIWLS